MFKHQVQVQMRNQIMDATLNLKPETATVQSLATNLET